MRDEAVLVSSFSFLFLIFFFFLAMKGVVRLKKHLERLCSTNLPVANKLVGLSYALVKF